jgi:hypothetical protein
MESHREEPDLKSALDNVGTACKLLHAVVDKDEEPSVSDYQLLGQCLLLTSSLEIDDDDLAIAAYDEACEILQKGLQLDPGILFLIIDNVHIREQLIDMQVISE